METTTMAKPENIGAAAQARHSTDTFPKLLQEHARVRGDRPAMREKDLGIWQTWTWREIADIF